MARIWQQGFEIPYSNYANYRNTGTIIYEDYSVTTKGRDNYQQYTPGSGVTGSDRGLGKYCFRFGRSYYDSFTGSAYINHDFDKQYTELFFRFFIKLYHSTASHNILKVTDSSNSTVFNMQVSSESTKFIAKFMNGSTNIITSEDISTNTWFKLDFHIDLPSNLIEVKINDKIIGSYNGTLTGTNMTKVVFGFYDSVTNATVRDLYFDDIAINDTTGAFNNSWCGNGSIVALQPIENGSLMEFTPLSGSNYENVDEITAPDGDTTYNSVSEAEKTDLFKIKKLSDYDIDDTTKINAISIIANARFEESSCAIAPIIKGTSTTEGSETTILGAYTAYNIGLYDVNPETSKQFTAKDLADLEFGYRSKEV